jgi:hypothetical protein
VTHWDVYLWLAREWRVGVERALILTLSEACTHIVVDPVEAVLRTETSQAVGTEIFSRKAKGKKKKES